MGDEARLLPTPQAEGGYAVISLLLLVAST